MGAASWQTEMARTLQRRPCGSPHLGRNARSRHSSGQANQVPLYVWEALDGSFTRDQRSRHPHSAQARKIGSLIRTGALAHQPSFVVADEPTSNLDSMTGREIALMLQRITHEQGIGMLIATHDNAVVSISDRVLTISDGMLQ